MWGLLPRSKDIALIFRTFKGQEYLKVQKHNFCPNRDFGWILFGFCIISQRLRNFHFQRRKCFCISKVLYHYQLRQVVGILLFIESCACIFYQSTFTFYWNSLAFRWITFTFHWILCMQIAKDYDLHFYLLLEHFYFSLRYSYFSLKHFYFSLNLVHARLQKIMICTFIFYWNTFTFHWDILTFHWNTFTFHWILCIQDCKRLWFALFLLLEHFYFYWNSFTFN